jgi:hypothetical protein
LNILVDGLEDLMKYAHINFNPKKCKALVHNPKKEFIIPAQLPNEKRELQDGGVCGIKETVKYLGIPLGTRKLQKMKFNRSRIEKNNQNTIKIKIQWIQNSSK